MGDVFLSGKKLPFSRAWPYLALAVVALWGGVIGAYLCIEGNKGETAKNDEDISVSVIENGYGLYIDGVFISACKDYNAVTEALSTVVNGLACAFGAPSEGEHSLCNDVRVVSGKYESSSFAGGERIASLLGVNGNTVSFTVSDIWGNSTDIELGISTNLTTTVGEVIEKPLVQNATDLLDEGVVVIVDGGADGVAQNTYRSSYINGVLTEKVLVNSMVISKPIPQEHWYGTESGATLLSVDTLFALPYNGRISSPYGYRRLWGKVELHNGIDFVGLEGGCYGDPIYAAHDGVVSHSGWKGGYGKAICIDHTQSITSLYAHCSELLVQEGEYVRKGQLIALIGNTGRVTGAHLHYSMFKDGVLCDPTPYLDWSGFNG